MSTDANLLLVDDEESVLLTLHAVLEREGYNVTTASSGADAIELVDNRQFDAALLDIRLDDYDGIELLEIIHSKQPDCAPIMLTGFASLESAVLAIRQGAYDYLMKPCDLNELKLTVARGVERAGLSKALRERVEELERANSTIKRFAEELEGRVEQATAELTRKVNELAEANRRLEAAQMRISFLAEVSTTLAASLDYEVTLKRVASLAVPAFADWCMVYVQDEEGKIRRVEAAHADPAKEALAQRLLAHNPDPSAPNHPVVQAIRTGKPVFRPVVTEEMLRQMAPDENYRTLLTELGVSSSVVVPLFAHGRAWGAISLVAGPSGRQFTTEDLSLAEEVGRRASMAIDNALLYREAQQAVQVRNAFLSVAAHELRTPTTTIKAYAQLLQRQIVPDAGAKHGEWLDTMVEQSTRLVSLVQELLDISRLESGQFELKLGRVDLGDLAREVVGRMEAVTAHHQLELDAPGPAPAKGDRDRLEQVLANLLDNAMKFSPEGGKVRTAVEARDGDVVVSVQDWGVGVAEPEQPHIFDRYYRGHLSVEYEGLGIGLHLSREIIERHGGRIWFESREGAGSIFYFSLPLAA